MVYRTSVQEVEDYYQRTELNQSSIKIIIKRGMQAFLADAQSLMAADEIYYEEKDWFIVGGAVDCELTMGRDVFKQKYHISTLTRKPGPGAMSVLKRAFDISKETFSGVDVDGLAYKQQIWEACTQEGYFLNRAKATLEEDKRPDLLLDGPGKAYWADMAMAGDKQILSDEQIVKIIALIGSFKLSSATGHLFKDSSSIDIVYQHIIYYKIDGVMCKCMLDMIRIDHSNMRIYPIDIKTMRENTLEFPETMISRRYDLQSSFYYFMLEKTIAELGKKIGKDLTGYTIADFAFITESTTNVGEPMIFVVGGHVMFTGEMGSGKYKGWRHGLNTYKTWQDKDFKLYDIIPGGILSINELNYNN